MSRYRRARSLDVLVAEANTAAPGRKKGKDGWIGDPDHQSRDSRHNPNDVDVVCAQDLTNDPPVFPVHKLARALVDRYRAAHRDGLYNIADPKKRREAFRARGLNVDFEYVISDGFVAKRSNGWIWVEYHGADPHDGHAHFAVGRGPDGEPTQPYDDPDQWGLVTFNVPSTEELTMADITQILNALSDLRGRLERVEEAVGTIPSNGAIDFGHSGGDRNYLWAVPDPKAKDGSEMLVQDVWHDGDWETRILVEGVRPGSLIGGPLLANGRTRIDVGVQLVDGRRLNVVYDPSAPGDLPGGWHLDEIAHG